MLYIRIHDEEDDENYYVPATAPQLLAACKAMGITTEPVAKAFLKAGLDGETLEVAKDYLLGTRDALEVGGFKGFSKLIGGMAAVLEAAAKEHDNAAT
jgi:hypothetical protein